MTFRALSSSKTIWAQVVYQAALIIFYALFFSRFFPNAHGAIGLDYEYFFPHLLDGYFWFRENGLLSIPWFSPGFCGGLPAWANPQNIYFSLPQFLTFAMGPLRGVFFTVLIFAWLGYLGMYLLARRVFGLRPLVATLAATLFFLNGFFFNRMAAGHLAFSAFMLTPLLCWCLLRPLAREKTRWQMAASFLFFSVIAGLIWAAMFYGGMLVLLVQTVVCVLGVACLYGFLKPDLKSFAGRFVLAGVIGLLLSLPRLLAVTAFAGNFPRNFYEIPGSTFGESISLFFRSLGLPAGWTFAPELISHSQWNPQQHEYDFSISPVPLIIIASGIIYLLVKHKGKLFAGAPFFKWLCASVFTLILLLPFALNIYSPGWHEFLKTVPVIKAASTMIRWYVIYVVLLILAAAILFEHAALFQKFKTPLAAAGIAIAVLIFGLQPTAYYEADYYNPDQILQSFEDHRAGGLAPQVKRVVMFADEEGKHVVVKGDNDVLTTQSSQLYCYEPIFGYNLEQFPRKELQPGPISIETGGVLNLKNPACYVYPEENSCRPGDHFTAAQKDDMENFAAYRPYPFAVPFQQTLANGISLAVFILCLIYLPVYAGTRLLWRK